MKRKLILGVLLVCLTVLLAIPAAAAAPYANAQALFEAWEREGYPDDVAGVYSVDGGTYLCILLLDDTPEREAEILALLEDDTVAFGQGTYSENEMRAVQAEIVERYMGGDSPVVSCGVGWTSEGGFGENGKESRVVVDVLADEAEAYAARLWEEYGGIVVVQSSSGIILDTTAVEEQAGPPWALLAVSLAALLAAAAFLTWFRPVCVVRTSTGQAALRRPLTRAQVLAAVRSGSAAPRDSLWPQIRVRLP